MNNFFGSGGMNNFFGSGEEGPSIPGKLFHIDFSKPESITLNGSTISQVRDSVSGIQFNQATAVNQPTYNATGINGKGAAQFDGVDDYLIGDSAARAIFSGRTVFSTVDVVRWDSAGTSNYAWFYSTAASSSTALGALYHTSSPGMFITRRRISTDGGNTGNLGTGLAQAHVIISTVTFATPLHVTFINGTQKSSSGTGLTTGAMNTETAQGHLIGSSTGVSGFLSGYYGERRIYDHVLTTDERTALQSFLKTKWNTP